MTSWGQKWAGQVTHVCRIHCIFITPENTLCCQQWCNSSLTTIIEHLSLKKCVLAFLPNIFSLFHSLSLKQTVNNTTLPWSHIVLLSFLFVTAWQDQHKFFLLHPFFFLSSPAPSAFLYLCLIYPFSQIGSWELRDICCAYFEDASCCSITYRAKVSFACSGIESASLTGGGREHARQAVW